MSKAVQDVVQERERQKHIIDEEFEAQNTANDFVAYITAYAGRAARKVLRNERQEETFRSNMVKVAAIAVAAIEAFDKGQFGE